MAKNRFNSNGKPREEIPKISLKWENLKEALLIFAYVKPYRVKFTTGLGFIALSAGTTMAFPYMLKLLIDSAHEINKGNGFSPGTIAILMIGILVVQMFFSYMRVFLFTSVGENALSDMRKDIYKRMIMMPMDFFSQHRVGELSSRISADLSQIQDAVSFALAEFIRGILTLIIGLILIFLLSTKLTVLMLSVVPVIVVVSVIFSKRIRKLARKAQDQLADSNIIVQETLQGINNVKSFSNEWFEMNRYSISIQKVVKLAVSNSRFRGLFISFVMFSVFSAIVLVVWYGAGLMQQGKLTFGDLTAFVVYTAFVGGSMAGFADLYSQLQKTLGATQRVRELLRENTESVTIEDIPLDKAFKLSGNVEMKEVAFSYPSRKDIQVLSKINLKAGRGSHVAIVGPSGAGKSTLISLLLRFYEPDSGTLLFDGKKASGFPLSQLRKQMALVPQDVFLFGGTILENILYGNPHATIEQIEEAAQKANAHGFIMSFPEGYQTIVGERGIMLSGGQRQRIAIARAILKDPVILILDEATSSLDSESELLVQEALENLMANRTTFVIAHRLSTIRKADNIVVIENGMIKESGTHQELIALDEGLYKNLNKLQYELN